MTNNVTNIEQAIKKFNTRFRKSPLWNPYGDETASFPRVTEEGYRKVFLGTGCSFMYIIKGKTMEVTEFYSNNGGITKDFSDYKAERGFMYMLGLSGFLNLNMLVITKKHLDAKNFDVFYKYGFDVYTDNNYVSTFTIDFNRGNFHELRKQFENLQIAVGKFKKEHKTIKIDWYDCRKQDDFISYQFSYYAHGIKSYFNLYSEEETIYLIDNTVDVRLNLDNDVPMSSHVDNFFQLIKEQGKFKALLQPSDVIYQEVLKNKLGVQKETHSEIFNYLTKSYSQDELDSRLIREDFSLSSKFRHSDDEMSFMRILDVFFIYQKENEELRYYPNDEEQKAKDIFAELATKTYNNHLLKELKKI